MFDVIQSYSNNGKTSVIILDTMEFNGEYSVDEWIDGFGFLTVFSNRDLEVAKNKARKLFVKGGQHV